MNFDNLLGYISVSPDNHTIRDVAAAAAVRFTAHLLYSQGPSLRGPAISPQVETSRPAIILGQFRSSRQKWISVSPAVVSGARGDSRSLLPAGSHSQHMIVEGA